MSIASRRTRSSPGDATKQPADLPPPLKLRRTRRVRLGKTTRCTTGCGARAVDRESWKRWPSRPREPSAVSLAVRFCAASLAASSVREADPDSADEFLLLPGIERFRRVAERVELESAVDVPRSVAGRLRKRECRCCAETQKPKRMIDAGELVVVIEAQPDLDRKRDVHRRIRPSRRDANLEVGSRVESTIGLTEPGMRIELECHESVRVQCPVAAHPERQFFHRAEGVVGTRVGRERAGDVEACGEAEIERAVKTIFVPEPAGRSFEAGASGVQAVPRADMQIRALDAAAAAVEINAGIN